MTNALNNIKRERLMLCNCKVPERLDEPAPDGRIVTSRPCGLAAITRWEFADGTVHFACSEHDSQLLKLLELPNHSAAAKE